MNKTPRPETGSTLSQILRAQGRRQDWFAQQVGVSQATVTRWCAGSHEIADEYVERIAEVLGVPSFLIKMSYQSDNSVLVAGRVDPQEIAS